MLHEDTLIATLAMCLALAFACGVLAVRLRLPPLVGYLLAGIALGPYTPGWVADPHLAPQLAEIGVMLLMFGVGTHFSFEDLVAVWRVAVPGAIAQIVVATALGALVAHFWGWPLGAGLLFGLALSVASTVVLLRALEERGLLTSPDGRIAVGWLVVEDLVTVLALVLLPALAPALGGRAPDGLGLDPQNLGRGIALTLGKVALFVALMRVVGVRVFPWILARVMRIQSRELFTLAAIALALGVAYGSARLFDVSLALGAFFAGAVISGTDVSHKAASYLQPFTDTFAALFFVAVGMLFEPAVLVRHPLEVLEVLAIIVVGKSLAALIIVRLLRRPLATALTVSASLAQIGEFSFMLAVMGLALGLLSAEAQSYIVAGALLSIMLNPLLFTAVARRRARLAATDGRATPI
ncbi:MAG TPA: cation:proton antiporter [Steroidobacteraceae bacterium]|jgi:CPA2 family monovalent cation:H+ antiporter-2|nr:cation:proton antiporter [Steroidobacteraceae bacterium]